LKYRIQPNLYIILSVSIESGTLCNYRKKFQKVSIPDNTDDKKHIEIWGDKRTVYLLFSNQYRHALNPFFAHRYTKYIPKNGNICEYGCGCSPITTSLIKFYTYKNFKITCADIPTIMFHFSGWKFKKESFVRMLKINAGNDEPLDDDYDVIFCLAVFEHMPRPIPVIEHLSSRIKTGGYLIFDYIKSEAKGLDTSGALKDRITVLQYIIKNFNIVEGRIPDNGENVDITVCRKL